MKMDQVKAFIDLAKHEGVSELKYESKDIKIAVSFVNSSSANYAPATPTIPSSVGPSTSKVATPKTESRSDLNEIKSPFVGTFYAAPSPDKPAFVKVGDRIRKGQTLCILEAMKIMNEIEAETDGVIVEICVENEALVEFGHTLFKIQKA